MDLERALTQRTIKAGNELCELRNSVAEAAASRDALAKAQARAPLSP